MNPCTLPLSRAKGLFLKILMRITVGFVVCMIATSSARGEAAKPGALIQVTMDSRVGVLLDEIPGSLREEIALSLLGRPQAFWHDQAHMQIEFTLHRLINRAAHYPDRNKFQLPLPPSPLWEIKTSLPVRARANGHDLVAVSYTLSTILFSDPI